MREIIREGRFVYCINGLPSRMRAVLLFLEYFGIFALMDQAAASQEFQAEVIICLKKVDNP
jgi:hypothetical protein